ncbi:MAG: GDSL-type esterase/lipase family protein [Candidatus Ventricola sp.]
MDLRIGRVKSADLPCAGFAQGDCGGAKGYASPVCMRVEAAQGRWRLSVCLRAQRDAQEVLLFANCRRLLWRGALRAGERRCVTALCMVHPVLPEGADEPAPGCGIELALVGDGVTVESVRAEAADVRAVLLMGDSTVTDQGALSPYAPGATYCGWGQMLPALLGEAACVGNFARSGLTAETFRTEGLYDLMKAQLRPGDLVLMQFGHNDQKRPHLTAEGGYAQALHAYVQELRALGAQPILVTPLARNSWWDERRYCDLLLPFAQAARRVAAQNGVPLIDLHAFMRALLMDTGRDAAKTLFHIGDYTHTNDFGAYRAAAFVAGELARLGLEDAAQGGAWTPHPPYDVPAAFQGDEALPPEGLEALYRRCEEIRPDAPLTRMEALELVNRTCGLFGHNAPVALPDDIAQGESFTEDVRCALQHRLIPAEMLSDGRLHRHRAVTEREFMRVLKAGYGMRCCADHLPDGGEAVITRAEAARLCRQAKI